MAEHERRTRILRLTTLAVVLALLLGGVVSWIVGGRLVAPDPRTVGDPPDGLSAEAVAIVDASGTTVRGWHVRARESDGIVVLLHGIHGTRRAMLSRAWFLLAAQYSVVMIDLRAHGESSGDSITLGFEEAHGVRAAVEFARREHSGEPVAVLGVSLGGASALFASPLDVEALILESVYPTIDAAVHNRVAVRLGLLSWIPAELLLMQIEPRLGLSRAQLRPIDRIADAGCPLLVMSGDRDTETKVDETRALFAAAREPKSLWLVEGAGHEDLHGASRDEYESRVLEFLARSAR